jgi:hypothetical protein
MAVAAGPSVKLVLIESMKADADLSAKQFYFVKMTANPREVGVCSATTDRPIGILMNKPDAAGKEAEVLVLGRTKVSSDAALNEGAAIGPSADGQAVAKTQTTGGDSTQYVGGTVIAASGAAGEMAEAIINCAVPHFIQI